MALTWREERPDAITAASHSAERPSRSMVTTFSALSSSSEARIRLSRSLCRAGLAAIAATFLALGFLADFPAVFPRVFGEVAFLAGAFALDLAFLAGFLV